MKLRLPIITALASLGLTLNAAAQDFAAVSATAKADLEKSLAELSQVQKQVGEERIPLSQQLSTAEEAVLNKRKDYEKIQRQRDNDLVDLNVLKDRVRKQKEELEYVNGLLQEFTAVFESRLHISELQVYQKQVQAVRQVAGNTDLSLEDRISNQFGLLDLAVTRIEALNGGHSFEGQALTPSGQLDKGKLVLMGPVALFASANGTTVGMVERQVGSKEPTVTVMDPKLASAMSQMVKTGAGDLVLDATLGNALKLEAMKMGVYDTLAQGGLVMIPLLLLGVASVIIALIKWFQFSRIRLASASDVQKVLDHIEKDQEGAALAHARAIPGPAGELLATAVEHVDEKKEYIEEILYEKMLDARIKVERGIAFLALAATTGPLMGLLGTVMGMIATFKLISSHGSGDPKLLAEGISEALIATATGMAVAIPALLLHAFLSRKAKGIIGSLEQTSVGFINGVKETEKPTFV
ncbi:MAG: exbB 1 [Verrucomicrobia bacterium]|nr:exbB 1 [Verrucomicrobiota bacterium]